VAVGEVEADRGGLGHDGIAIDERGQLAHGILVGDARLLLPALHDVDEAELVGGSDLFEHPDAVRSA
jgi:hypothetical protein